jgi:hypothetical protein
VGLAGLGDLQHIAQTIGAQRQAFAISDDLQERLDHIDEKGPMARFVYGSKVVFPWAEHFVRKYMAVDALLNKKF